MAWGKTLNSETVKVVTSGAMKHYHNIMKVVKLTFLFPPLLLHSCPKKKFMARFVRRVASRARPGAWKKAEVWWRQFIVTCSQGMYDRKCREPLKPSGVTLKDQKKSELEAGILPNHRSFWRKIAE